MLFRSPGVAAPNRTVFMEGSRGGFVDLRSGIGSGSVGKEGGGIGLSIHFKKDWTGVVSTSSTGGRTTSKVVGTSMGRRTSSICEKHSPGVVGTSTGGRTRCDVTCNIM